MKVTVFGKKYIFDTIYEFEAIINTIDNEKDIIDGLLEAVSDHDEFYGSILKKLDDYKTFYFILDSYTDSYAIDFEKDLPNFLRNIIDRAVKYKKIIFLLHLYDLYYGNDDLLDERLSKHTLHIIEEHPYITMIPKGSDSGLSEQSKYHISMSSYISSCEALEKLWRRKKRD